MDYQEFKVWTEKHKIKFMLGAAFIVVFLAGFGTGRYEKVPARDQKTLTNYSTKSSQKQKTENQETDAAGEGVDAAAANAEPQKVLGTTTPASTLCKIKGNISSGSKKIYHVPGGAFYKTVSPEMCFNTEAEALAAGFKKSGR